MKGGYPSNIMYMSLKWEAGVNNDAKVYYLCTQWNRNALQGYNVIR